MITGKFDTIPSDNVFNILAPESNKVVKLLFISAMTSGNTAVIPFAISLTRGNIF